MKQCGGAHFWTEVWCSVCVCVCVCVCVRVCDQRAKCHVSLDQMFLFTARMSPPFWLWQHLSILLPQMYNIYGHLTSLTHTHEITRAHTHTHTHFSGVWVKERSRMSKKGSWKMIHKSGRERSEGLIRTKLCGTWRRSHTHTSTYKCAHGYTGKNTHKQRQKHTQQCMSGRHQGCETCLCGSVDVSEWSITA